MSHWSDIEPFLGVTSSDMDWSDIEPFPQDRSPIPSRAPFPPVTPVGEGKEGGGGR